MCIAYAYKLVCIAFKRWFTFCLVAWVVLAVVNADECNSVEITFSGSRLAKIVGIGVSA